MFKNVLKEQEIEQLLKIKTSGRDDSISNTFNYPYEPTDYPVLERLANSGYITKKSKLIDYGAGKGRVSFYLAYQTGCNAIGIEYDERLYEKAIKNMENYPKPYNVSFELINAVDYQVPMEANCFFFFNPFSEEILKSVINRIKKSYYENPRELYLFFYYPSKEYISYLNTDYELTFEDEINCRDLFEKDDDREVIFIYTI